MARVARERHGQVAVIVAAFNAQEWIAETLASVQAQTFRDWDLLVVDDGSTDGTADIVARFAAADSRIGLLSQPNGGVVAARTAGLSVVPPDSEFVAFLDSDDLWEAAALDDLVQALRARPDAVGAYGLADYINAQGELLAPGSHLRRQRDRRAVSGWRLRDVDPADDCAFDTIVVSGPIWPTAVALIRLVAMGKVGGFDPSYRTQEDWDLYLRLSRNGPFVTVNHRVAFYRRHAGNATSNHAVNVYDQHRLRYNAYHSPANTGPQRKTVARAWRYLTARQASVLGKEALGYLRQRQSRLFVRRCVGAALCTWATLHPSPRDPRQWTIPYTDPTAMAEMTTLG